VKTRMAVEGMKELDAALAELPKATGKNVLRRVARKSIGIVVEAARPLVPVDNGKLKRSLSVSTKLSKRQSSLARRELAEGKASVTVYAGVGAYPHAHLVEFGTKERFHKSGKSVGRMKPQPFMRPAWDSTKMRVLATFQKDMWTEIEKAAQRLAKKQARHLAKSKA
jgi:HK97 gp10 family phage protein